MSTQKAERTFLRIAASDDDELWELVCEWAPSYRRREDDYGNEVIARFGDHGIDPGPIVELNHNQIISRGIKAIEEANVQAAAAAFVTGIALDGWERVRWLIPLRAISNTAQLPKHSFRDDDARCKTCGQARESKWDPIQAAWSLTIGDCGEDWEVLNNVMMVRWFNQSDPPSPRKSDIAFFNRVIKFVADADKDITAYKLAKQIKCQYKGEEETWRVFFEALGFAGVLKTDKQPGHLQHWTDLEDRARPKGRGDARSPVCYWRRELGFDPVVFDELFPRCRLPKRLQSTTDV